MGELYIYPSEWSSWRPEICTGFWRVAQLRMVHELVGQQVNGRVEGGVLVFW